MQPRLEIRQSITSVSGLREEKWTKSRQLHCWCWIEDNRMKSKLDTRFSLPFESQERVLFYWAGINMDVQCASRSTRDDNCADKDDDYGSQSDHKPNGIVPDEWLAGMLISQFYWQSFPNHMRYSPTLGHQAVTVVCPQSAVTTGRFPPKSSIESSQRSGQLLRQVWTKNSVNFNLRALWRRSQKHNFFCMLRCLEDCF